MSSQTYHLKYRPKKIADLDLSDVVVSLSRILKSSKLSQALLFSGPKGTGKTSAARIFARAINCEKRDVKKGIFEPCNSCPTCKSFLSGSSLDVIEIDGASNRGIDDVRVLREGVNLAASASAYKIYIIDEVHMLTKEAFNALLKTLEEPPAHVVFILCTTEPEKLPDTIVSRVLRINFKKAGETELLRALKRVVKGEKLKVEDGVLKMIASQSEGSFRDAQKLLDQLSMGDGKLTLKRAEEFLGQTKSHSPKIFLELLVKKELKNSLLELDRVVERGVDLPKFSKEALEILRSVLLFKAGVESQDIDSSIKEMDIVSLYKLINLFSRASLDVKSNPIAQLPLELLVVSWCGGQEGGESQNDPLIGEKSVSNNVKKESEKQEEKTSFKTPLTSLELLQKVKDSWNEILVGVRPLNHSVEALLRSSRPKEAKDDGTLVLEVFYPFHKERLETEKCRLIIEEVAGQITGSRIKLRCVLGQKTEEKNEIQEEPEGSRNEDSMAQAADIFGVN